ncbi:hypothetical protein GCM10007916_00570 [Psychromonas marina]|uniref:ATP-binding protein n=1 Tax=Psychromonas marina TaxID=88364 RepID=A0ABQ6DV63_9GAMM|nr:hypothetical protein [Psychromonas marina]GLS88990.1 hypothetical protein GCM10007916_00570 [Psychromonas marina]
MQKIYNRETELNELQRVTANIADSKGKLSVVVGKRRIGKTATAKHDGRNDLY